MALMLSSLVFLWVSTTENVASSEAPATPAVEAPVEAADALVPPVPMGGLDIAYPSDVQPRGEAVKVVVSILVDRAGEVAEVTLVRGAGAGFDDAVMTGATHFQFEPATYKGQPVAVMIQYTKEFVAVVETTTEQIERAEAPRAIVAGKVLTRGSGDPVDGADVVVTLETGEVYEVLTGEDGAFELTIAPGAFELIIGSSGYKKFLLRESVADGERLKLRCLIEKRSYDPYETVVVGKRKRVEISRTTLKDRELKRIPGTFGDPYKVIATLPGVTQAMSLMPLPIIRGSSPGMSGYLYDKIRLPLLFHLLYGPSVIHPELIERIDFHPGGASVRYGGYTGGIVAGYSPRPFRDRSTRVEIDTSSGQAGVFFRTAVFGESGVVTGAARYGYPGLFLKLVNAGVSLDYWDYQLNLDLGDPTSVWSFSVFGALDDLREYDRREALQEQEVEEEQNFMATFHRGAVRYRHRSDVVRGDYRLVLGADRTKIAAGEQTTDTLSYEARADLSGKLGDWVGWGMGARGQSRDVTITVDPAAWGDQDTIGTAFGLQQGGTKYRGGGYVLSDIGDEERWLISPGLRFDAYEREGEWLDGFSPRVQGRVRLMSEAEQSLWLKGGVGKYLQPPRPFLVLPGLDTSALDLGLVESVQSMLGLEYRLDETWEIDLQGYYNDLNPIYFELTANDCWYDDLDSDPWESGYDDDPYDDEFKTDTTTEALTRKREGRSYGVELLLRKHDTSKWFGWISYALSRSERIKDGAYIPYDFDRTHVFNVVSGLRLPRNWELALRGTYQTGTPLKILLDCNAGRSESQLRVDIRIDKRVVYDEWLFDFYVDIINVAVGRDSGGLLRDDGFRFVLPTLGFRAVL